MNYIAIITQQLESFGATFVAMVPQFIAGIVVLVITWLIAKSATRLAEKVIGKTDIRQSLQQLLETVMRLAIWLVGLLIVAAIVFPGFTAGGIIAGLGIGAVAIGFAFQDIFENFLAGVLIMLREKMRIGDLIEVDGIMGKVERITLRETYIRQLSNELTLMPNAMLFKNPVKILTDEDIRRNEVVVGVSYDTDLDLAQRVIGEAMETVDAIVKDKPVIVYAQSFGGSSIDFLVQWYAQSAARDLRQTKSEAIKAIKRALDEAGIDIPFPIQTTLFPEPLRIIGNDTRQAKSGAA